MLRILRTLPALPRLCLSVSLGLLLSAPLLLATPASAGVEVQLLSGTKVLGEHGPNRGEDVYVVDVPADSQLTVLVKGKRTKGQKETPVVDFALFNDAGTELATGLRRPIPNGAKLKRFPINTTGRYTIRVAADSDLRGTYQLTVSWTTIRRTVSTPQLPAAGAQVSVLASGGSTANVVVKPVRGSTARPRIAALNFDTGTVATFDPPKANARAHKVKKVLLAETGFYALDLTNDGVAGLVNVVVVFKQLKRKGRMDLTSSVLGPASGATTPCGRGAPIGPAGGRVALSEEDAPGLGGAVLDVPAGTFSGLTDVFLGSGIGIVQDPDDALEGLGPTVQIALNGGSFGATPATLTLPFDAAALRGSADDVRVVRVDGSGRGELLASSATTADVGAGTVTLAIDAPGLFRVFGPPRPLQFSNRLGLVTGETDFNDRLGSAVAISGATAAVGAIGDTASGIQSGSVYVFTRTDDTWAVEQHLTANDGAPNDTYGAALALQGDTLVVSSPGHDAGQINSGSVYVYRRDAGVWSLEARLQPDEVQFGAAFGSAVALDGETLLIGARLHDNGASSNGGAYVFQREADTWTQTAFLAPRKSSANDQFGSSVSLSGGRALIGAPLDDERGPDAGAAYVFAQEGSGWVEQVKLIGDGQSPGGLGSAVALDGALAALGSSSIVDAGAVYVFVNANGKWGQQARVVPTDGSAADLFGAALDLRGRALVVGATGASTSGAAFGAVYTFARGPGGWVQQQKLVPDPATSGFAGASVRFEGDTLLVGAPDDATIDVRAGAAFSYDRED